jgi:Ni/Co efflux regulator RcnB
MTIARSLTSMIIAAALAASAMAPIATAASADGWRDGRGGHHIARKAPRRHHIARNAPRRHWRGGRNHHRYVYRHRRRDKTGRYIAIGVGAFMLGLIAAQTHRPYYD